MADDNFSKNVRIDRRKERVLKRLHCNQDEKNSNAESQTVPVMNNDEKCMSALDRSSFSLINGNLQIFNLQPYGSKSSHKHQDLFKEVAIKNKECQTKFLEVSKKLNQIKEMKGVEQLSKLMIEQQKQISEIMESKNATINHLKSVIRDMQLDHENNVSTHVENIKRIKNEASIDIINYSISLKEDIKLYEKKVDQEKSQRLGANLNSLEQLCYICCQIEENHKKSFQNMLKLHVNDIDSLFYSNKKQIHRLRLKSYHDNLNIKQEIKSAKRSFLLNSDRLKYNYEVLKRKNEENAIAKSEKERLLVSLRSQRKSLEIKMDDCEKNIADSKGKVEAKVAKITKHKNSLDNDAKLNITNSIMRQYSNDLLISISRFDDKTKAKKFSELNDMFQEEISNSLLHIFELKKHIYENILEVEEAETDYFLCAKTHVHGSKDSKNPLKESSKCSSTVLFHLIHSQICSNDSGSMDEIMKPFTDPSGVKMMSETPENSSAMFDDSLISPSQRDGISDFSAKIYDEEVIISAYEYVVSEEMDCFLNDALKYIKKYWQLLKKRKELITDNTALKKENKQLLQLHDLS